MLSDAKIVDYTQDYFYGCPLSYNGMESDACIGSLCAGYINVSKKCFYAIAANFGLELLKDTLYKKTDPQLIKNFQEIYTEYYGRIFKIAYRMLKNRELAEDITQETFIRAYKHAKEIKADKAFSSWLYKVATNLCLDVIRKNKSRNFEIRNELDIEEIGRKFKDCYKNSPEFLYDEKQTEEIIDKVFRLLPTHYCQLLVMRCIDGLSYDEIASATNTTIASVRSVIYRAKRQFIKNYSQLINQLQ